MLSYNHKRFINEAINSVIDQSFSDWELIIIDDASTDGSQEIIRKFSDDRRIQLIFHESNKGIPASTNEGIDVARGKFIAFLDSDDVWQFEKLSKQLAILNEDDDLVVWSEGDIIDENGTVLAKKFTEKYRAQNRKKSGDIFDSLIESNFIFQSSFIIKADNLKKIRLNEGLKYLNDYQYVVELAAKHNYYFIEEPLAKYRTHKKSTARIGLDIYLTEEIKLRTYFIEKFSDRLSCDQIHRNNVRMAKLLIMRIIKRGAQNTELSSQIAEIRSSIFWQLILTYQNDFFARFLPMISKRRQSNDSGIKGNRALVNDDPGKFCTKFYNFIAKPQYKKLPHELSVIIPIFSESRDMSDIFRILSSWNLRGVEFVILNFTDEFQFSEVFDRVYEVLRSADIGIGRRRFLKIYAAFIWLQDHFPMSQSQNNILNLSSNKRELGFSEALNKAIKSSSGKYIFILNSNKLMNNNIIYLFNFINKILSGERLFRFSCGAPQREMVSYDNIASNAYRLSDVKIDNKYSSMLSDMVFFSKDWIDRLGGFDDSFQTTQYTKSNLESIATAINYKNDVLDEAAHRFNSEPSTLKCLKRSSNSVYECQINGADSILRLICRSRDWLPLVKGEIDWVNYLGDNGVPVCRASLSASGNYVEVIERPNDYFFVSVFTKAHGHTIDLSSDCEWNDALFNKWGAIMGKMHYLSKKYNVTDPSTKRPDWNREFVFDPQFDLGSDNKKVLRIWRALLDELDTLPKNKESYGLVHNDFHYNNFIYHCNSITIIDFDDCAYNWFIGDMATSLYHAVMTVPKYERNKFARRFIRNFFAGYNSENNLENYWIDLLPKFIQLRHIYSYLFYLKNWNLTTLTYEQRGILAFLKSSIESEKPIIDINFKDIWNDIAFRGPEC